LQEQYYLVIILPQGSWNSYCNSQGVTRSRKSRVPLWKIQDCWVTYNISEHFTAYEKI